VVMGGAPCCEGNVDAGGGVQHLVRSGGGADCGEEWNAGGDGGLALCRGEAVLNLKEIEKVMGFGTAVAKFAIECNSRAQEAFHVQTGEHGISLPDPVAMAVALDESIVTSASEHFWDVETESELTRGMTVVDRLNVRGMRGIGRCGRVQIGSGRKAKIVWTIDNARWKEELFARLR